MSAYYNENDPYAAQWLRNLIAAGHIAAGDVDERSIVDVKPDEVRGYRQCHFFAGIGAWSYALRLAGWPDDRECWTGSCPCQPFSSAGKGAAFADDRHLWPQWFRLIRECLPSRIFGEQVEAAIRWGWLDLVFADLEGQLYACGAAVLPACSVKAPHIRKRLWFVADTLPAGRAEWRTSTGDRQIAGSGSAGELADTNTARLGERRPGEASNGRDAPRFEPAGFCIAGELGFANSDGRAPWSSAAAPYRHRHPTLATGWDDLEWLPCTDGKSRPTKPGLFPLAHGVPGRVGKLRAYGNAIVPQVAAEFIRAVMP